MMRLVCDNCGEEYFRDKGAYRQAMKAKHHYCSVPCSVKGRTGRGSIYSKPLHVDEAEINRMCEEAIEKAMRRLDKKIAKLEVYRGK